jgi:hypothetical protein
MDISPIVIRPTIIPGTKHLAEEESMGRKDLHTVKSSTLCPHRCLAKGPEHLLEILIPHTPHTRFGQIGPAITKLHDDFAAFLMHSICHGLKTWDEFVRVNTQLPGLVPSKLVHKSMSGDDQAHTPIRKLGHEIIHSWRTGPLIGCQSVPGRRPYKPVRQGHPVNLALFK